MRRVIEKTIVSIEEGALCHRMLESEIIFINPRIFSWLIIIITRVIILWVFQSLIPNEEH